MSARAEAGDHSECGADGSDRELLAEDRGRTTWFVDQVLPTVVDSSGAPKFKVREQ